MGEMRSHWRRRGREKQGLRQGGQRNLYSPFLETEPGQPYCLQVLMCLPTPSYPSQDNQGLGSGQGTGHLQLPGQGWGRGWV